MQIREDAVRFGPAGSLAGVVAYPARPDGKSRPAVVLLNAGIIHRVGPNRLYVNLARHLAKAGHTVIRFDFSGIGDSAMSSRVASFRERSIEDVRAAFDVLHADHGATHFAVAGICLGADVAFRVAARDERANDVIIINGGIVDIEVHPERATAALARTQSRLYRKRMFSAKSWMRALRGHSDMRAIRSALRRLVGLGKPGAAPAIVDVEVTEELRALRDKRVLFVYSEGSTYWDLFKLYVQPAITELNRSQIEIVRDADHVFTPCWSQDLLIDVISDWLSADE